MFTREKLKKSPITKKENISYGYLVCSKCNGFYKLKKGESPTDFESCQCGGDLNYIKDIDANLNEKISNEKKVDKQKKEFKKQNEDLTKTKKALENEISERKKLKETFEGKINALEKQLTEKNDELLGVKKELKNLISDNKRLKENFKKKLKKLEKQLTEKNDELLETKKALEMDISKHKQKERHQKKYEYIIAIKGLKKSYDNGKIRALNGIDLQIKKGEFVSIIGPSGSGKSTLLNMIGALDKANEGYINVAGMDLMKNKDLSQFRSKEIGFVFQLHNLIPNLTVLENVQIPMFGTKLSGKEMERRALELLKAVDLEDKIDQNPTKLSGGERQRVAIARALVNHPSIILADEPTGALDSKTGDIILNLIKDVHKKENVTLVMVTHEPYVAEMADRTITVLDGKVSDT